MYIFFWKKTGFGEFERRREVRVYVMRDRILAILYIALIPAIHSGARFFENVLLSLPKKYRPLGMALGSQVPGPRAAPASPWRRTPKSVRSIL